MNENRPDRLKIGDEINGTIVKAIGGRRFLIKSSEAPNGWKVELHARKPEEIEMGSHTTFWVAKLNPIKFEMLVRDGDYGRLPISDAMKARYRTGLNALIGNEELTGDALADVRSMVQRCLKQDQADWLTVYQVLGEPSHRELQVLEENFQRLRTTRKETPEKFDEVLAVFREQFGEQMKVVLGEIV